jgi:hypothetical protein
VTKRKPNRTRKRHNLERTVARAYEPAEKDQWYCQVTVFVEGACRTGTRFDRLLLENDHMKLAHGLFASFALIFAVAASSRAVAQTAGSAGTPAPTARIKDIMIYQVGGWAGAAGPHKSLRDADYEWPAYGGMSAYRSRSPDILAHQMTLIAGLGNQVAIGVLLMTDSDSAKSGYGTCWNGSWSSNSPGGNGCDNGTLTYPLAMYDNVRTAARAAGVRYAPDFSLMNYDGVRGSAVLPKLEQFIDWWRPRLPDPSAARAPDGHYYVIVDSLPPQDDFSDADKKALIAYMKSQSDIDWIDNMVDDDNHPSSYSGNVYRSAASPDYQAQRAIALREDSHYLWWFAANRVTRTYREAELAANKVPEDGRLMLLNIRPYDPSKYPVMISQWNEYGEYLFFEPSTKSGDRNYDYLKGRLSQQP